MAKLDRYNNGSIQHGYEKFAGRNHDLERRKRVGGDLRLIFQWGILILILAPSTWSSSLQV